MSLNTFIGTKCFGQGDKKEHIVFQIGQKWFALSSNFQNASKWIQVEHFYFRGKSIDRNQYLIVIKPPIILRECRVEVKPEIKDFLKLNRLI